MQHPQEKINADCIIPAAGLSSRMGEWKLMLPYNNSTIVEASIKNALRVCSRVILVVGFRAEELIEQVAQYPDVDIVINENFRQGMYSSIQEGVKHVKSDYFYITHADMPCIEPEVFLSLWHGRSSGSVFPGSEKQSGHPVLISSQLVADIIGQKHPATMKKVLTRFPTSFLNLNTAEIYFDVDTPTAYQQLINNKK